MEELKKEVIKLSKTRRNLLIILVILLMLFMPIIPNIHDIIKTIKESKCETTFYEMEIYNPKVKPYLGDTVKGSEVKSMLDVIISMNQENSTETGKFITINAKNIKKYDNASEELAEVCNTCNYFGVITEKGDFTTDTKGEGNNSEENVKEATNVMNKLKQKINSAKRYKITAVEVETKYVCVTIEELPSENKTENTVKNEIEE